MKITSIDIISEIERLAEALPWDQVDIWTRRTPEGEYRFVAYVHDNAKFGFSSESSSELSPKDAVDSVLKDCANRDPEIARKKKIAELKAQIEKLQAVLIGMPPWKPGRTLSNGEAAIEVKETVNV
jgi:hypothetical protein